MAKNKNWLGLRKPNTLLKPIFTLVAGLLLISFLAACGTQSMINAPTSTEPVSTAQISAGTETTANKIVAKPQGELVAAISGFGNEIFLPWQEDLASSQIGCIVYDMLIYWDEVNRKFIPGLAEKWELSSDAGFLTYHLRKGVQWQEGWGELTAEDVKYTFEKQMNTPSGLTATRSIASMEIPDPYTLVVKFKTPQPTFFMVISLGDGGTMQGIACKKYVETVGEEAASQKPIGSGPYKLVESQLGSYYKFEAMENHWRVVPEFKTLIVRAIPEISTTVAMLKTKEIDLANISAEQMADLKASGIAVEASTIGGSILNIGWGALCIPADYRYKVDYHNKDPWKDMRVRKAMTISIDRKAISDAIFSGSAPPVGVPLHTADMNKYQHPYDPAAAKQLIKDAGYPNGFSFKLMSFTLRGVPEAPRVMEAVAGFWQQIGLDPKITPVEQMTFNRGRTFLKNAGQIGPQTFAPGPDMLEKAALYLMPSGQAPLFIDEGSYAIWKEGYPKVSADERAVYVEKLQQYYFENYGPIPMFKISYCYAWNPEKLSPFPHSQSLNPLYTEYVRHEQPLNTFRLFTPWEGR